MAGQTRRRGPRTPAEINRSNREFWASRQKQVDQLLENPSDAVHRALDGAIRQQQANEPAIRALVEKAGRRIDDANAALLVTARALMGPADYLEQMQQAARKVERTQPATEARRNEGRETFKRVSDELERNPFITTQALAEQLEMSVEQVARYLRKIRADNKK